MAAERRKKEEGKHNNDILSGLTSLPFKLYVSLPSTFQFLLYSG
jgi:hypothetical protein